MLYPLSYRGGEACPRVVVAGAGSKSAAMRRPRAATPPTPYPAAPPPLAARGVPST